MIGTHTKTHTQRPRRRTRPVPTSVMPRPRFHWYWLLLIILLIVSGFYISRLDVQIREKFEGNRWALPARVYARPLELYTGMQLKPAWLEKELAALGYRRTNQPYEQGQYQRTNNDFFLITRGFKFWDANEISRMVQIRFQGESVSSISEVQPIDRKLALVRMEPKLIGKIYPTHNEDRIVMRLKEIPKLLVDALISIEDRNFYSHMGVSLRGSARALVKNLEEGGWVQGGSTITQQLVKNFFLSPERTLERKFNEAIMAFLLEWHYTKEQILEAYLNEVYIGQDGNRSIHGMGMGAQFYFNRPLEELKLEELALLVSLVRAPSSYDPRKHPQRALERRNLVLDAMTEQKMIEPAEAKIAKATLLNVTEEVIGSAFSYPAFVEVVRAQLRQDYRENDLRSEGLQIFTTLDPFMQEMAETAL
ncbi:MAG: penicillin-binding protein 1B, partial [Beggiatoa sp. IS2]